MGIFSKLLTLFPVAVLQISDRIEVSTEVTALLEHAQVTSSSMTFPLPATSLQTADLTGVM